MRQTLSRGMVAAAAATGILSLCGSPVFADSSASGASSGSPGLASGNTLEAPVNVPVNVCGNTADVAAALNPAFGNACVNGRGATGSSAATAPGTTVPAQVPRDSGAGTPATHPGSGHPSTPTGSSVTHRTPGTGQGSDQSGHGTIPPQGAQPPQEDFPQADAPQADVPADTPQADAQPGAGSRKLPALAETGSEGILAASAVSVAMLAGGLILYRRGRVTSRR